MTMIYLGSPYSHENKRIKELRFRAVVSSTAMMMEMGAMVFSPIAHSHHIAGCLEAINNKDREESGAWQTWEKFDLYMLERSDIMAVLLLQDWQKSKGLRAEIAFAKDKKIPVHYIHPKLHLKLDLNLLLGTDCLMPDDNEFPYLTPEHIGEFYYGERPDGNPDRR